MKTNGPKWKRTERVMIKDISKREGQSGWRDMDAERQAELETDFRDGAYRMTVLDRPSLLEFGGQKCNDADGLWLVDDGYQTIVVLDKLYAAWTRGLEVSDNLQEDFQNGILVDIVEYEDDDRDAREWWNAGKHDEDSNKFVPTKIKTKVKVALSFHKKTPGGDWAATAKTMTAYYGKSKARTVSRWCSAAQIVPEEVLDMVSARRNFLVGYIFDNIHFTGPDKNKILSSNAMKIALTLLFEELDSRVGVSVPDFENRWCAPLRVAELWTKRFLSRFGDVARTNPGFQRVVDMLHSKAGRSKILACMTSGCPLEGRSSEDCGIAECHNIVAELKNKKAGSSHPAENPPGSTTAGADNNTTSGAEHRDAPPVAPPVPVEEATPEEKADSDIMQELFNASFKPQQRSSVPIPTQKEEAKDSVSVVYAKSKEELSSIKVYDDMANLSEVLAPALAVNATGRTMMFVDAPSSKAKVAAAYLSAVGVAAKAAKLQRSVVLASVGPRMTSVATVDAKMSELWPDNAQSVIPLTAGALQSAQTRPSWLITSSTDCDDASMPTVLAILRSRAKPIEATRFRCCNSKCREAA